MLRSKWSSIIIYLTNFLIFNFLYADVDDEDLDDHPLELLHVHRELMVYLKSVEFVAQYCLANLNDVNINLAFGLFAARIHMKEIYEVIDEDKLPKSLKERFNKVIETMSNVIKRYRFRIDSMTGGDEEMFKQFTDTKCWMQRIKNLKNVTQYPYLASELVDIYTPWDNYQKNIAKFNYWIPSPRQSESCLKSLAKNPISYRSFFTIFANRQCDISPVCLVFLNSGTTFGYALYHRLLLLIIARYGRGCIISYYTSEDEALMRQFCSMGYAEVSFIVLHDYGNPDIMLEIMFLCSLIGQVEFLNRTWLRTLLKYQIQKGCFGSKTTVITRPPPSFRRTPNGTRVVLGCNSHITGVAVGTYAAAVRYNTQKYFKKNIP